MAVQLIVDLSERRYQVGKEIMKSKPNSCCVRAHSGNLLYVLVVKWPNNIERNRSCSPNMLPQIKQILNFVYCPKVSQMH